MKKLTNLKPSSVFKYFEEICSIPHGSGDMVKIADYCVDFAREFGLEFIRDDANNVIIYKNGTFGMENHPPVILQGHTDMVCQKTAECTIDFEKDGLEIYTDGDFVKAKGTTLGADNGIAVAMIMAILASDNLSHPPIEAVFTTDEEIGMIGAGQLDTSLLKGKRMINLDSEEEDVLTVSCAGGSDFTAEMGIERVSVGGQLIKVKISGLLGGHSGVEIDKGRVNANILAGRVLSSLSDDFGIISINGGNKMNAIPLACEIELVVNDREKFKESLEKVGDLIKKELSDREEKLEILCEIGDVGEYQAITEDSKAKLMMYLISTPNGIIDMSMGIEGLVETSLNLGILKTDADKIQFVYALRSNKATSLDYLQDRMTKFAEFLSCKVKISGRYEPWEYKSESSLRELYREVFREKMGKEPTVSAIHAGLECAVFSASIPELDCIAIGPEMSGVHTTDEKLSISSTEKIYEILCCLLSKI